VPPRKKIPQDTRTELLELQWGMCEVCSMPLEPEIMQIDHQVPLASGGDDSIANLHALCPNCHARKTVREASKRKVERACTGSEYLCWVCGKVCSIYFAHACSGQFWYQK
jgi:5-methylcytosine-specific restriction enzyme A